VLSLYFIQFAYNFAIVGPIIFIPLLAESLHASPAVIGLIVATYQVMLFAASALFGRLADLKGHKLFIVLGLLISTAVFLGHLWITGIPSMFLIRALAGLAVGIFPAAVIAYATRGEHNLGRLAGAGSLGYGLGSLVAGIIAGYHQVFLLSAGIFLAGFVVALLALKESRERVNQSFFNAELLKRNWRVYLSFFLRHAGANGVWAIFPLYLERLGASNFWIGVIYALNSVGQAAFMPLVHRWRSTRLIQIGLFASILTFGSFAFSRNFKQLLPLQLLLAFAWSCLYVGSLKYLLETNSERSTAIGLLNSTQGLSGIAGALIGGAVASLGLPAVMVCATILSLGGAAVFQFKPGATRA
jgi:MFS family permease